MIEKIITLGRINFIFGTSDKVPDIQITVKHNHCIRTERSNRTTSRAGNTGRAVLSARRRIHRNRYIIIGIWPHGMQHKNKTILGQC